MLLVAVGFMYPQGYLKQKIREDGWLENHDNPVIWKMIEKIPDEDLWKTHYWLKIKLIDAIRERTRLRWAEDRLKRVLNDRWRPIQIIFAGKEYIEKFYSAALKNIY